MAWGACLQRIVVPARDMLLCFYYLFTLVINIINIIIYLAADAHHVTNVTRTEYSSLLFIFMFVRGFTGMCSMM